MASILTTKEKHRESMKTKHLKEEDRISSLPDDILSHILCFLPSKYAVGTSILSKRWKNIWISVPNLDFDASLLFDEGLSYDEHKTYFTNFLDRFMSCHSNLSSVRTFRLHCCAILDRSRINELIFAAVTMRNVKVLDLHVYPMPNIVFTSQNLVMLSLRPVMKVPMLVCLSSLKILHIAFLGPQFEDSMKRLLSGCPVLEELHIDSELMDTWTLYVCSSSLKRLMVYNMEFPQGNPCLFNVVVEAPNLEYLDVTDKRINDICIKDISSLVSASIDIGQYYYHLIEVLNKISKVLKLRLSTHTINMIYSYDFKELHVFHNLTYLKMGGYGAVWKFIPYILKCAPNLTTFVFEEMHRDGDSCYYKWDPPDLVPKCNLLFHLEMVDVRVSEPFEAVMVMIRYFLQNAMVLKKMAIYFEKCLDSKEELDVVNELLMLSKASNTCQVVFYKELP